MRTNAIIIVYCVVDLQLPMSKGHVCESSGNLRRCILQLALMVNLVNMLKRDEYI
jgi:hypothetical protein